MGRPRYLIRSAAAAALLPLLFAQGPPAAGQSADDVAWDSPRALELMDRARARRLLPAQDTTLRSYTARAEGFVYFYLDRREADERTLVKVDQVALEVFWAPPNRTRQHIVGMRDASRLPNRMHYHLDHLTVVQDGFGDVIRMGDGDEVADVPHPAAPGSDSIYQFRLTDSLTLQLPGVAQPIRVYEVQVRPFRTDRSALVGSVFVDRDGGDIVRMTFTFTPASYVDRRLDYISVSLDNGLWEGRYWLPHEQTLQIRRQIPELDFAAGAVIHGRMRISDYTFNDSIPDRTFYGYPVTAVPRDQRERFEFERDIYDDLNEAGLATPPDLGDVRRQAASMLGTARLSGLPAWRPSLGSASSAFRYNRAEGVAIGAGVAYAPGPPWRVDVRGGYAFGADRPWGDARIRRELGPGIDATLRLLVREARDVSPSSAVPTLINTGAGLFFGDDYLDLHFVSGAALGFRRRLGGAWRGSVEATLERHRDATLTQGTATFGSEPFRPVRRIDEGDLAGVTVSLDRVVPDPRSAAWGGAVRVEAGTFDGRTYIRPTLSGSLLRAAADHARTLLLTGSAGWVSSSAPVQRLFALGGYGTLPGYEYRSFAGSRYGLAQAEAAASVVEPWLSLRLVAAAGAVSGDVPGIGESPPPPPDGATAPSRWQTAPTGGLRTSAGAGVSLFWDLLRVDAIRGLDGGSWRLQLSFHREFRDIS
jgi:hypothetical protein